MQWRRRLCQRCALPKPRLTADVMLQYKMTRAEFLKLMRFPKEWDTWGMYPDELFQAQVQLYKPGDERGAEHDRNGAFHWWLKRDPSKEQLLNLARLTGLDDDQLMAEDVRRYIRKAKQYGPDIEEAITNAT